MQGPAAFEDMHRRMCGWSPSWQQFAGRFGDCAANAQNPSGPIAGAPIASSDPLETLTRRGYSISQNDFYRAISTNRREDIELLLKAGLKPGPLLDRVTISPDMWRFLVEKGVVQDEPCTFSKPEASDESLLSGVISRNNGQIYRSLCQGKYVAAISAFVAKAKQENAGKAADAKSGDAKRRAESAKAISRCKTGIDQAFPDTATDQWELCFRGQPKSNREVEAKTAACQKAEAIELALRDLENSLRQLGFKWETNNDIGDCTKYGTCAGGLAGEIASARVNFTISMRNVGFYWARNNKVTSWSDARIDRIAQHCEQFEIKRFTAEPLAHADFIEKFERVMAGN